MYQDTWGIIFDWFMTTYTRSQTYQNSICIPKIINTKSINHKTIELFFFLKLVWKKPDLHIKEIDSFNIEYHTSGKSNIRNTNQKKKKKKLCAFVPHFFYSIQIYGNKHLQTKGYRQSLIECRFK